MCLVRTAVLCSDVERARASECGWKVGGPTERRLSDVATWRNYPMNMEWETNLIKRKEK